MTPVATMAEGAGFTGAAATSELSNTAVASWSVEDRALPHREQETVPAGCASSQYGHTIQLPSRAFRSGFTAAAFCILIMGQNSPVYQPEIAALAV